MSDWRSMFPKENRYFETENGILYCGDALEILKNFPNDTIDLVVTDPPYNIGKAEWDKWKTMDEYVNFMGNVFKEIERVLKITGSFYFFHNNFSQMARLHVWIEDNTNFIFKRLIVWNKRFEGSDKKGYFDGFVRVKNLRNYQQMAEYILFYVLRNDDYLFNVECFQSLRQYFRELQKYIGLSKSEIIRKVGHGADHCFRWNSSQWALPTEETYNKLIREFGIDRWEGFKDYKELRKEYDELKNEITYTFNNQRTHHSVWNYDIAEKIGHITPKPVPLIENILLHSSNEGDIVLDPFLGSGTVSVAAEKLNRRWIGIEINPEYCDIARKRIEMRS